MLSEADEMAMRAASRAKPASLPLVGVPLASGEPLPGMAPAPAPAPLVPATVNLATRLAVLEEFRCYVLAKSPPLAASTPPDAKDAEIARLLAALTKIRDRPETTAAGYSATFSCLSEVKRIAEETLEATPPAAEPAVAPISPSPSPSPTQAAHPKIEKGFEDRTILAGEAVFIAANKIVFGRNISDYLSGLWEILRALDNNFAGYLWRDEESAIKDLNKRHKH